MIKAELLAQPVTEIPGEIPAKTKKKGVILTGRTFITREGRVIETDVWNKGTLKIRHFTGMKGFWNYNVTLGMWDNCTLEWLFDTTQRPDLEVGQYREAVEEFAVKLETWRVHARDVVENCEREIKWEKSRIAEKKKYKRINEEQGEICPNLPEDFAAFCKKCAEKEKEGASFGIQLYQEANDGMTIERQFRVKKDGGLTVTEEARGYAYDAGERWRKFVYGCYTGAYGKRQGFWDKKNYSAVHVNLQRRFYLYTKNLEDQVEDADFLKKLTALSPKCEWSSVMREIRGSEALKHIFAAGLTKLTSEIIEQKSTIKHNPTARKLHTYLQITPQQLAYLKETNGGEASLYFLQRDTENRLRVDDLRLIEKYVTSYSINTWLQIFDRGLNLRHAAKLLADKRGRIKLEVLRKYGDYLDMAEQNGSDAHDEIIYRNKRWLEFHDRYVEQLNERRRQEEAQMKEAVKDNFKGIRRDFRKNCELFQWEKGEYCIVVPRSSKDIIAEGQKQHHCVGASDRYMKSMAIRKTFILFLRKKEDPKKPYYTIEADLNRVIQFYAAYDRQPDREKVQKILNEWMKQVRKNAARLEKKGAA